mgnify:FL=1
MPRPSRVKILAQAEAMGLKLSSDGKSWEPINQLAIGTLQPKTMKAKQDSTSEIIELVIFTIFGIACLIGFLYSVFRGALTDSIFSVLVSLFFLSFALFSLTPLYFHLTQSEENNAPHIVRTSHPVILNGQQLRKQKEERIMGIFGTIGLSFLLMFVIIAIVVAIATAIIVILFLYLIQGMGGGGW